MIIYTVKQGDTFPPFQPILKSTVPFDLNQVTAIRFVFRPSGTSRRKVGGGATAVLDAVAKRVSYAWLAEDTVQPGIYEFQWELEFGAGNQMTFPNHGYSQFVVEQAI